jgi:N-acetylneuraminic acid mutarotase
MVSYRFILCSLCLFFCQHLLIAQPSWQQQANFPGAGRYWCSGFSIGDRVYIGLGFNPTGGSSGGSVYYSDFYEYNSTTNSWTQKASFPGAARLYATGFTINGKGYFCCGWSNNSGYQTQLWEYDPAANTWTARASVPGPGRWGAVGFSIGANGYVVSGDTQGNGQGCINSFYRYNQSSNSWTQLPDFPGTAVYGAAGFSIGNQGYIGTGYDGVDVHDEFYRWDEDTDTWSQMADFGGAPRYQNVGFAIGNNGYIGLGSSGNGDFWQYNPATNTWLQQPDYPGSGINVNGAAATATAGFVGLGQTANQQWWKFTPQDCSASVAFISTEGETEFCANDSVTLIASSGSGYLWSNGEESASITVTEAGQYSVVVQFENGCSDEASQSVTVYSLPVVSISASQDTVCLGESITLNAAGNLTYFWNQEVELGVPFDPGNSGYYILTGTDVNTCSATDSLWIQVNSLPSVQLDFDAQEVLCAGQGSVELNEGFPAGGVYSGNFISNNTVNTTIPGSIDVIYTITDENGCANSATDTLTIEVCTFSGTSEYLSLNVFPNPLGSSRTLVLDATTEPITNIQLFDASGRLINIPFWDTNAGTLNLQTLTPGTYFLVVQQNQQRSSRCLILY